MKEERKNNVKYEELNIQGKTSTEVDGKICEAICNRGDSIIKCGKITITKFNENSSGSKCELDSLI